MRVTNAVPRKKRSRQRKELSKGYYARNKNRNLCNSIIERAHNFMFRDRKNFKRNIRKSWIMTINAAVSPITSYSKFICCYNKKAMPLNRKMLARLAIEEPENFKTIVYEALS